MARLTKLTVRGFKSIKSLEGFELRNLNVLIGANGAGKSNFIGLFKMLAAMRRKNFQFFVAKQGGPDALFIMAEKRQDNSLLNFFSAQTIIALS
jgi:predicted ATPase